jgi:hypothetical protein
MLRNLLLSGAFLYLSTFVVCAQSYSYGFEGSINDNQVDRLLTDLENVEGVIEVKIRYKSESHRGEILLYTKEPDLNAKSEFSSIHVKRILLNHKLSPLEFVQISKNQLK